MSSFAVRRAGARQAGAALRRYDNEAREVLAAAAQEQAAGAAALAAERAAADAAAPCDLSTLERGSRIRTRHGWLTVVKVNTVTVIATGGFLGRELIQKSKIIEVAA